MDDNKLIELKMGCHPILYIFFFCLLIFNIIEKEMGFFQLYQTIPAGGGYDAIGMQFQPDDGFIRRRPPFI